MLPINQSHVIHFLQFKKYGLCILPKSELSVQLALFTHPSSNIRDATYLESFNT